MRTIYQTEELIQYEDEAVIVVRKPAGLAVESRRVTETDLESLLRRYLAEHGGGELYMVHRLDQPVEGLMAFAKTKEAARSLSEQLTSGQMQKIYRAKVEGSIPSDEAVLEDYLLKQPGGNRSVVISKEKAKQMNGRNRPKKAVLHYRKVGEQEVEITLKTGRHHQIRVQLSHVGMPIRGDRKYGASETGPLCLASVRLVFVHPVSKKQMMFETEPSF